jgi:hypothetical protein
MNDSHDHAPAGPARIVLAERKNAGIQVTLLWAEDTNAVAVLVRDDGTDEQFELSVEPGTDALDLRAPVCARRVAWRRLPARRIAAGGVSTLSPPALTKQTCIWCGRRIATALWRLGSTRCHDCR